MIQFLEDMKGEGTPALNNQERDELEKLRKETAKLKQIIDKKEKSGKKKDKDSDSD